jgi:hypothetical protein
MNTKIEIPDNPKAHEIRPGRRDFGFIVIGLTLGVCLGGAIAHIGPVFLIVFTSALAAYGVRLICSAPKSPAERSHL